MSQLQYGHGAGFGKLLDPARRLIPTAQGFIGGPAGSRIPADLITLEVCRQDFIRQIDLGRLFLRLVFEPGVNRKPVRVPYRHGIAIGILQVFHRRIDRKVQNFITTGYFHRLPMETGFKAGI